MSIRVCGRVRLLGESIQKEVSKMHLHKGLGDASDAKEGFASPSGHDTIQVDSSMSSCVYGSSSANVEVVSCKDSNLQASMSPL